MPFWDYETEEEERRRVSSRVSQRLSSMAWQRIASSNLRGRGIDPDTIPSLQPRTTYVSQYIKGAGELITGLAKWAPQAAQGMAEAEKAARAQAVSQAFEKKSWLEKATDKAVSEVVSPAVSAFRGSIFAGPQYEPKAFTRPQMAPIPPRGTTLPQLYEEGRRPLAPGETFAEPYIQEPRPGLLTQGIPGLLAQGIQAAREEPMIAGPFYNPPGPEPSAMERLGAAQQRYVNPSQAAVMQGIDIAGYPGALAGQGVREIEQALGGRQAPPAPPVSPRGRVVNPFRAAMGDEKEIARGQEVLNELGLGRYVVEALLDPLNAVPIVGFTKVDDIVRLFRGVSRLKGAERTAAFAKLAKEPALKELLEGLSWREVGEEAGIKEYQREIAGINTTIKVHPDHIRADMITTKGSSPASARAALEGIAELSVDSGLPVRSPVVNSGVAKLMELAGAKQVGVETPEGLQGAREIIARRMGRPVESLPTSEVPVYELSPGEAKRTLAAISGADRSVDAVARLKAVRANRIREDIANLEDLLARGGKATAGAGRRAAIQRRINGLYGMLDETPPAAKTEAEAARTADLVPGEGSIEGGGSPPTEPPSAVGMDPEERLPTIREVESQAAGAKLSQADRDALGEKFLLQEATGRGQGNVYSMLHPTYLGEMILSGATKGLQDLAGRAINIPGVGTLAKAVNRVAEAAENPVLMQRIIHGINMHIQTSVANLATDNWWREMKSAFKWQRSRDVGKDWRAVVELRPGVKVHDNARGFILDLVEHTDDYVLNDQQLVALAHAKQLQSNMRNAQLAMGVDVPQSELEYMRRLVRETPEGKVKNGVVRRRRIGATPGSSKPRVFKDSRSGIAAGYVYESDPRVLMRTRLNEGIRTVVDRNAYRNLIAQGVDWRERVSLSLSEKLANDKSVLKVARVNANKKTATDVERAAFETARRNYIQSLKTHREVKSVAKLPGFGEIRGPGNRIFKEEYGDELREFLTFATTPSQVEQIHLLLRAFRTTADISATLVQKAVMPFNHPIVWAKTSAQAVLTVLGDPLEYAAKNYDELAETIYYGAGHRPTEFLFAETGIASIPTKLPLIGSIFKGANRAFSWSVLMSENEVFQLEKAGLEYRLGRAATDAEKAGLGAAVQKSHGAMTDAALGLTSHQKTVESMALFASRFFRSNVGLVADAFQPGPRGHYARVTLTRFFTAGTAATMGLNMAMNDGKLPNLTRPDKAGWFQVRTPKGYVSLFGPFHPFMQAIARDAFQLATDPKNPNGYLEPLKTLMRGKASIPLQIAADLYYASRGNKENIYGERLPTSPISSLVYAGKQVIPLGAEQVYEGVTEGRYESVGELAGLRTRGFTTWQKFSDAFKQQTSDDYNGTPADLRRIKDNPLLTTLYDDVGKERRDRGDQTAIAIYNTRQVIKQEEVDRGLVRLAETVLSGDALAAANWKDARADFLAARSMKWEGVLKDREPRNALDALIQSYYRLNPKSPQYTDSAGNTDWTGYREAQDAILDQMPPEEADALRNTEKFLNPTAEKVDKLFRADQEILRPYWDTEDAVWDDLQSSYPELQRYNSYNDLFKEKAEELLSMGVPQEELQYRLNNLPILTNIGNLVDRAKQNYRRMHPDVDAALIRWGYASTPIAYQRTGEPGRISHRYSGRVSVRA